LPLSQAVRHGASARRSTGRFNDRTAGEHGGAMKKLLATIMSVATLAVLSPLAEAQSACPPEVAQAKDMMNRMASVQAPRALAGARGQDVQAGRGQNVQAGR